MPRAACLARDRGPLGVNQREQICDLSGDGMSVSGTPETIDLTFLMVGFLG